MNFSVFAKRSTSVQLLLFDRADDAKPSRVIDLDPTRHRTYHYWHAFVPGLRAGQLYGYRVAGPVDHSQGLRFDPEKLLLDPYGRCVARPAGRSRRAAQIAGDNNAAAFKSAVVDTDLYDWEGDAPPRRPFAHTVIYEMHLRGFTRHPGSGVAAEKRGTFAGLIDKIPYLEDLGVTAVQLLPVFAFDEQDGPVGLGNYWGYQPISFFAPHPGYSSSPDPLAAVDEFRDMVKALHRAGIEVILDVVYNHTAEGDAAGPTICFRGFSNETYYILGHDKSRYADYSGCGNTLKANEPVVRRLILDSLRYWVSEMHVDGFRFDLASILSRDQDGMPMANPPILWEIESDPVLANVKLIAEAWDAAGLYQVGSFVGDSWKELNGRYRDDVRAFVKGDNGVVRAFAYRLTGSPDVYMHDGREAEQSVNFVTSHDGFTLNDLVSFNTKHNEANGEHNRDGGNDNLSWNCGVEGPTDDPEIEQLRQRQIKNFLTLLLLSTGTPMLLMGDEVRRSQAGNNNAFCQDNEISWFDWALLREHADIHRFTKGLVAAKMNRELPIERLAMTLGELLQRQPFRWHGVHQDAPDWSDESHTLAATVELLGYPVTMHIMVNAFWEGLAFDLPGLQRGGTWRRFIDTSVAAPGDICSLEEAPTVEGPTYLVQPRSVVLVVAHVGKRP
ncbi:glycogen debranching protein GlgX [Enterovirga sp. CN4-39]|uniref:glycogen debranching protein GlgX n=1 Tax=Enterovirga sp. CN4-39 TaxID=3400910 RepID=UPI003BFF7245